MRVGFIGLGKMGSAMAQNLIRAGHELRLYNRSPQAAKALELEKAVAVKSPREACREAEVVITMLADDSATKQIVHGENGILEGLNEGAIHLAASTISPALAIRLSRTHGERGQFYLSAPVFGRPEAAQAKKLWFVVSGPEAQVARCQPIFDGTSQGVFSVGEAPGLANSFKLAGNFLIASMLESLGEAFSFICKSGGDEKLFLNVVNAALFKSPLYENYGKLMNERNFEPAGFLLRLALKDIRLVREASDKVEVPMPVADVIHAHMLSGVACGQSEKDWAVLGQIIRQRAGL